MVHSSSPETLDETPNWFENVNMGFLEKIMLSASSTLNRSPPGLLRPWSAVGSALAAAAAALERLRGNSAAPPAIRYSYSQSYYGTIYLVIIVTILACKGLR